VLVRHGESAWNESKHVQGQSGDIPLTARGIEQARAAAESLRECSFDSILSSDLERALQTANILGEALGLKVSVAPSLRERSFGIYEGGPIADLPARFSGIEKGLVVSDQARPKDGESLRDLHVRVGVLVEQLRSEHQWKRLLLVTHGGTIRAIRAYCAGVSMQHLTWDTVGNCSTWTVQLPAAPN
jgi:broad specificity phosphatase PhoE